MPNLPLRTVSPTDPLDDLAPFLQQTASCEVIGLGEATHGTREAFQLKHRLIRVLAEHGGLRTVAFECGLAAGRQIDAYIRHGRGAAREALALQGYWCWENQEILELVEWLRRHNAPLDPSDRVAFVGVDVQKVELGLPELVAALEGARAGRAMGAAGDSSNTAGPLDAVKVVRRLQAGELSAQPPEAAQAVGVLMDAAPKLPTPELRALCRNVARYIDTYLNPEREDGLAMRDEYMALTALEVLEERPGLMVVWAHNEHVALNPDFFGTRAMGHHLRDALGEKYLSLGMLFGEGSFLARTWGARPDNKVAEFRVGQAAAQHVERRFSDQSLGLYGGAGLTASAGARFRRFLGNLYDHDVNAANPDAFRIERPLTDFDLVAWLPETTAARYIGAELATTVGESA